MSLLALKWEQKDVDVIINQFTIAHEQQIKNVVIHMITQLILNWLASYAYATFFVGCC